MTHKELLGNGFLKGYVLREPAQIETELNTCCDVLLSTSKEEQKECIGFSLELQYKQANSLKWEMKNKCS
jgi:hypothetical protein